MTVLTKRRKFVLVAVILALGILVTQLVQVSLRYQALAVLTFLTFGLSAWSLFDDLNGVEWLTVLTLPVLYPLAVGLFYFLLPERFLSRVFILGLFGVGMYALLLTANIFSVAAGKTIQLLRTAHAVGFLMTLVVAFFLYDTILSFRLPFWANFLLVFLVSWMLAAQFLWSVELTERSISNRVMAFASLIAMTIAEFVWMLSFWPVTIAVGSVFLVTSLYVALGISQQHFVGRLFRRTLYEYIGFGMVALGTVVFLTKWG
ncbi:MAG: hypothetical protein HYS86_05270 [Candidatus Chisholmbacteria bacterium]|nr:hypothetical protein [Candidatus Chisholmbacteria bacterium]